MKKITENQKIELTEEDAQVLINIINVAVKAEGLKVAKSALYFFDKIQQAFMKK